MPTVAAVAGCLASRPLRLPPLAEGCTFGLCYDVVLCIDTREQFTSNRDTQTRGLGAQVDALRNLGIRAETRALGVADAMWIARHRYAGGRGGA